MDFSGRWANQRNSVLTLSQNGPSISGTFDSGVSDGGKVEVAVIGWAEGDRISFTARYEKFGTVVAWVGQAVDEPGKPKLMTQWLHAVDIKDGDEHQSLWTSTRVGSDIFERAP